MAVRVSVLGSQTFLAAAPRVGIQHIAQGLAERGCEVHYLSAPSSPLDALSPSRHERFGRAWLQRASKMPVEVAPRLYEHVVRAPFPINRKAWLLPQQAALYPLLLPQNLKSIPFEVCLHDASPSHILLDTLCAKAVVLRLNDQPEGFAAHVPDVITERLVARLRSGRYAEVWAVSPALAAYAARRAPTTPTLVLPNGVDLRRFAALPGRARAPQSAVFVGALEGWVDLTLLEATARLLPEWRFDLFGPYRGPPFQAPNLRHLGVLPYAQVPEALREYQVGLIPFQHDPLVAVMEKPLKFFEYLAAGLGVAATDVGGLKVGMGEWASFGTTPESFAAAVLSAAQDTEHRAEERQAFLEQHSWNAIVDGMATRLEALRERSPGSR